MFGFCVFTGVAVTVNQGLTFSTNVFGVKVNVSGLETPLMC